jgi:hypothetical protein
LISSAIRCRALAAVVVACVCWLPTTAGAQLVSAGPPTATALTPNGSLNDIAYDDKHNVYLHVFGITQVFGRFVNADGVPVGDPFRISTTSAVFAGWPRVAYSRYSDDDVFMVVFSTDIHRPDRSKNVYGQRIRFNGSGPEFLGANFPISDASLNPAWPQEAGGLAFNTQTKQFLVTWGDARGQYDAFCRLFRTDGTPVGGEVNLSDAPNWQGAPNAAYDWQKNRFLVTYQGEQPVIGSWARLLDGNTAAPITGLIVVSTGGFQAEETVVYLPESGQYLVAWMDIRAGNETDVMGRLVSFDGVPSSPVYPIVATPRLFDGSPALGYNAGLRTTLAAAKHDSRYVWASELDGIGNVKRSFQGSTAPPTPTGGAFTPRVIAGPYSQFGLAYMMNYQTSWVERLSAPLAPERGPEPGGTPPPPPPPVNIDLSNTAAPNGSWFLAEGVESGTVTGFHTFYLISNENDVAVSVHAYFAGDDGRLIERTYAVPARSRYTVSLADAVGTGAFGAVFQSRTPGADIFVARSIYWGPNLEGSTGAQATKALPTTWHFAEGSRGGELFHNFFLIFNPLSQPTPVVVTFARADGVNVTRSYTVPAQRRLTLNANDIPELAGRDFSTSIETGTGVVAERAMYWSLLFSADPTWIGGTATLGAPSMSAYWAFAEGAAAPGFETFYLLLNPNAFPITVNGALVLENGTTVDQTYQLPPRSRSTVYLNAVAGNVGGASAVFNSPDGSFIAERSVYWGTGRVEGTNAVGATSAAHEWHFPEGATTGQFDTFLLLGNLSGSPSTVWITLYVEGIGRFTVSQLPQSLPAIGRKTVHMNSFLTQVETLENLPPGSLRDRAFSYKVNVVEGGAIVAEQAVYWQRAGSDYWRSGSASFGISR